MKQQLIVISVSEMLNSDYLAQPKPFLDQKNAGILANEALNCLVSFVISYLSNLFLVHVCN